MGLLPFTPVRNGVRLISNICSGARANRICFSRRRSVRDHCSYDYAVIRVVPRVDREEFMNVGVIVSCPAKDFLEARIEMDEARLLGFDPTLDLDAVRAHLA